MPALDREATGLLASRLIGRLPDEGGVEEIFRRTQGLPLAIAEWSRLGDRDEAVATPVPISSLVERAYARGVEAAPEPVRAMLLVAAADDSGDLSTVLAAAERLDIPATAADGAEELGLIEVADGRVRFRHPLVRSAVYQSAGAPLRRRAHGALAACLSGEWQADRRAWHRAAAVAGADEDVAAELAAMAERARARSGYAVAARALERAAQITPAPERRVARTIAAADAFWLAGRGSHAEELLTAALAEARDPLLRADADHLLGRQLQWRGDPAAARDVLVAGALRVEHADPRCAAELIASAQHSSWLCGRRELVRETAATLARLAVPARVEEDARLSAMTGAALTICERLQAAEQYLRRSIELAARADPFALVYVANSHGWLCEYRAARDLAASALEAGQELRAAGTAAWASELLAEYSCTLGDYDAAGAIWTETARMAEETEQPHTLAWCRLHLGFLAANRESEQEAARLVDSALDAEEPLWSIGIDASGLGARDIGARTRRRRDRRQAAREHRPRHLPGQLHAMDGRRRPGRGAHAGREADARPRRRSTRSRRTRIQAWARAALDRARGMVAADDAFDAPLERSAAAFAGSACGWRRRGAASATENGCGAPGAAYRLARSYVRRSRSSSACAARRGSSAPRASCERAARRCARAGRGPRSTN